MYEIPSRPEIRRVVVDAEAIEGSRPPARFDAAGRPADSPTPDSLSDAA
jgi:hypothetical protein